MLQSKFFQFKGLMIFVLVNGPVFFWPLVIWINVLKNVDYENKCY